MLDRLDHQVIQAIQHFPRVSYADIARVLDTSEQTVARRYRRLHHDGVIRVLGLLRPKEQEAQWITRVRSRPDRTATLADSLARRPDVAYLTVASGGSEIVCAIRSPIGSSPDTLMDQLPRSAAVLEVSIDLLLHRFGVDGPNDWVAATFPLTQEQIELLSAARPPVGQRLLRTGPTEEDKALIATLAEDGRTSFAGLAAVTGWTEDRVRRRVSGLETADFLFFEVDLVPEQMGYGLAADIWMRAGPKNVSSIGEGLATHPEVLFAGAIGGANNIIAQVLCRDSQHLYDYLSNGFAELEGITSYEVSVITRRVKQAGSLVRGGRLVATASPGLSQP